MPFSPQEKAGLTQLLQILIDADEPETMLACLKHVAERKAFSVTRGVISREESARWSALADALRAAEDKLNKAA